MEGNTTAFDTNSSDWPCLFNSPSRHEPFDYIRFRIDQSMRSAHLVAGRPQQISLTQCHNKLGKLGLLMDARVLFWFFSAAGCDHTFCSQYPLLTKKQFKLWCTLISVSLSKGTRFILTGLNEESTDSIKEDDLLPHWSRFMNSFSSNVSSLFSWQKYKFEKQLLPGEKKKSLGNTRDYQCWCLNRD